MAYGSGDRRQMLSDWTVQVALGRMRDLEVLHKFGTNPAIDTTEETIWNIGGDYTWLTTGTDLEITCSDNVNGQGQTIRVVGLDENWDEQEVDVVLTGTTPAALTGSWTIVHRAYQVSAAPDPVGDVYISTTAATYTTPGVPNENNLVQAKLDNTNAAHHPENAFVLVPRGHVGVVFDFEGEMKQATGTARTADCAIEVAELALGASVTNPSWAPRRRVDAVQVGTVAPVSKEELKFPLVFPELTRIEARGIATAASEIRMDFSVIFVPTI